MLGILYVLQGEVVKLVYCVCSMARLHYDLTSDPASNETFIEALDWLYQLCADNPDSVTLLQQTLEYINAVRNASTDKESGLQEDTQLTGQPKTNSCQKGAAVSYSQECDKSLSKELQLSHSSSLTQTLVSSELLSEKSNISDTADKCDNPNSAEETKENAKPCYREKVSDSCCHGDGRTMFGCLDNKAVTRLCDQTGQLKLVPSSPTTEDSTGFPS